MSSHRGHRTRGGFTLIEVVIAASLLVVLAGSLIAALDGLRGMTMSGTSDSALQESGEKALSRIIDDLRRSGFDTVAGNAFPATFVDGDAQGPFAGHFHPPTTKQAVFGDPDFGPNREIIFLQPQDADGDGKPDIDGAGDLIWDAQQFSFVVVTQADGANVLQRRINGASPQFLARNVERLVFDTNATSGGAIPLDAIRVRLFLREQDADGLVHRYRAEAVIKLRNGNLTGS